MADENTTTWAGGVATTEPAPEKHKPIWERLAEMGEALSEEDKAKLPEDLSEQLDHYLYGWPKRPQP